MSIIIINYQVQKESVFSFLFYLFQFKIYRFCANLFVSLMISVVRLFHNNKNKTVQQIQKTIQNVRPFANRSNKHYFIYFENLHLWFVRTDSFFSLSFLQSLPPFNQKKTNHRKPKKEQIVVFVYHFLISPCATFRSCFYCIYNKSSFCYCVLCVCVCSSCNINIYLYVYGGIHLF